MVLDTPLGILASALIEDVVNGPLLNGIAQGLHGLARKKKRNTQATSLGRLHVCARSYTCVSLIAHWRVTGPPDTSGGGVEGVAIGEAQGPGGLDQVLLQGEGALEVGVASDQASQVNVVLPATKAHQAVRTLELDF